MAFLMALKDSFDKIKGKKKKKDNYARNFPLPKTSTYSPWEEDNICSTV